MPLDPLRVKALFIAALDRDDLSDRGAFLDAECGDDADLRARVAALLTALDHPDAALGNSFAAEATAADFIIGATAEIPSGPTIGLGEPAAARPDRPSFNFTSPVGTTIAGRYKIRQEIGEGGMGTVYLADQIQPVKRQVALKLIRAGMDSRTVLARFESERQALAIMDHPHIARVLDAGTTDSGHPFFVMDLVRGIPLTDFCDQHRLGLPQRLALFRQICSAVQHAHQKGIIHRDLKPTNILVEDHDGHPVPKVIDFGLAKATSGMQLSEQSLFTAFGSITGTPLYMAPEQATFNAVDVDTRADIYALGVILYELLTGSTPILKESIQQAALDEMLRIIREDEPPIPSHRISTSEALPSLAANRHVEPTRLGRLLQGDLDWIAMKALAKERVRRYDSAIELANDVERFLNDEPVTAGPPTARYRTAKFIRRYRGQVVAASLIVLALIGGSIGTTLGLFEARRQANLANERAEGERRAKLDAQEKKALAEANEEKAIAAAEGERTAKETAEAVLGFVEDKVFAAARPQGQERGLGYDVKLADAIAAALPAIETGFVGKPLIEARLRTTIGQSFLYLGKPNLAAEQFAAAWSLNTEHLGPDRPDTLASMFGLADSYTALGRYAEALKLHEETLALRQAKLGPNHPDTLASDYKLATGYYLLGRHAEAVKLFEETLTLQKAKLGPDHPKTLRTMNNLALSYRGVGRNAEALKLREETLAIQKAKLGPDHPSTLYSMINLAESYNLVGRDAEALRLAEESVALQKAVLGPDHPDSLWNAIYLAYCYGRHGRHAEALRIYEETLAVQKAVLGPDHPDTLNSMSYLVNGYSNLRRHAEALGLAVETLAFMKAKLGPDHPDTLQIMTDLAGAYADTGAVDKAIALDRECLDAYKRLDRAGSPEMAAARRSAASRLLRREKWAEAEPMLRESLAVHQAKLSDDWKTFDTQSLLGGALLGLGRYDEARPILVAGFEGMKHRLATIPAPDLGEPVAAADRLIRLAEATNKPQEANAWREEKNRLEALLKMPAPTRAPPPQTDGAKPKPVDAQPAVPTQLKPAPTLTPRPARGKP